MARTSGLDGGLGLQPLPPSLTTPSGTAGLPPVAKGWGLDLEPAVSPKWPHPSEGSWGGRYLRAESLGCPRPQRRPNASAGPRACWGLGGQLCSCLISLLAPALPPASEGTHLPRFASWGHAPDLLRFPQVRALGAGAGG